MEVVNMPYTDGTGPFGKGAMTGRGMGPCAGGNVTLRRGMGRRWAFAGISKEEQKKMLEEEKNAIEAELKELE
ncbi:MAG: DUF5320 domain-containing protein [Candidatus Woesearchaeota archaeon]